MKKLSKLDFVKENNEYIKTVLNEILVFIDSNSEINLRSDTTSFRMTLINYLYNIYLNEY